MHTSTIDAGMVQLALVTRKMRLGSRWAAMSAHVHTADCRFRLAPSYRLPQQSVAQPMSRGNLDQVVRRVKSQGRREVLVTFGCGVRAITADAARHFLGA